MVVTLPPGLVFGERYCREFIMLILDLRVEESSVPTGSGWFRILALWLTLWLLGGCSVAPDNELALDAPQEQMNAKQQGLRLYSCISCHAADGTGKN